MNIIQTANSAYITDVQAIVVNAKAPSRDVFKEPETPKDVGTYKVAPWGESNGMPQEVLGKVEEVDEIEANLFFNICVAFGQGLKPVIRSVVNGQTEYLDLTYEDKKQAEVLDWCERNDIEGFFLEQITDMHHFFNVFPEILLNGKGNKITTIRHKEATKSRWGVIEKNQARVTKHYYSAYWDDESNLSPENVTETKVLDRYDTLYSLQEEVKRDKVNPKSLRYIIPICFPTPGRDYYAQPYWYSIFKSGIYELAAMIPKIKKSSLNHNLGVRYIIYVNPKYWEVLFEAKGVMGDEEEEKKVKKKELENIQKFLTGKDNAGKGLVTTQEYIPTASGVSSEKYIEIVPIDNPVKDGELIKDSEGVTNKIAYVMQIHKNLVGSDSSSSGSLGGTDKRELMNIKQDMMTPFIKRILKPLYIVKQYNKWPKDIVFVNPHFEYTTLDKNTSGKEEVIDK